MNFKEWLRVQEGEYGTSAAGIIEPERVDGTGVVEPGGMGNDGDTGRSKYRTNSSKMKKSRPMRGLAGF